MGLLVSIGGRQLWNRLEVHFQGVSYQFLVTIFVLLPLVTGLYAGFQIYQNCNYSKENWRALAEQLRKTNVSKQPVWLMDAESIPALRYYLGDWFEHLELAESAQCQDSCWWILRRPYTATHAFSSAVVSSGHLDDIRTPVGCSTELYWKDEAGLELWDVICEDL
jgi:hypothetical protein